jgi:hypothetical protein
MKTTHPHRARLATRLLALPLLALVATCTDTTAPDRVIGGGLVLELVSGQDQTFVRGRRPDSLVVRVVSIDGEPQSGVSVEWRVVEGNGYFQHGLTQIPRLEVATGEDGLAAAQWWVGPSSLAQAVEVSVGDRHLRLDALAEPRDWMDALDIRPAVEVVDDELRARILIRNDWTGTMVLRYGQECLVHAHLFTLAGQQVEGWVPCFWVPVGSGTVTYHLPPGGLIRRPSSSSTWQIAMSRLEPGTYALRFRFHDGLEINGRLADLPDITVLHLVVD